MKSTTETTGNGLKKRIFLGFVAVLAGLGLWLCRAPAEAVSASATEASAEVPDPPVAEVALIQTPTPVATLPKVIYEPEAPKTVLDPNSEDFFERVDVAIPRQLYARAAECDTGDAGRNEKVKLQVRVRAENKEISVLEANILESTIVNKSLENCIRDAVKNARWDDEEMPNWEDEDEILIRVRGMKKHIPISDEDYDAREAAISRD